MSSKARKREDWWTDPADITAALRRAARRAHEIALESGTKIITVVDGKTVAIDPDPERFDSPAPRSR